MFRSRKRWWLAGLTVSLRGGFFASVGCLPRQADTTRAQAEFDAEKDIAASIGSKTVIGNTEPIAISAVGLVYNLKGSGSSPQADGWREQLEKNFKKRNLNPKKFLDDPTKSTSLVLVSGVIPPGARNGYKYDVMITMPQGSKTTSLQHWVLDTCDLTNFEQASNIRETVKDAGFGAGKVPENGGDGLILGGKLATAEGTLVVGSLIPLKQDANGESTIDTELAATDNPSLRIAKVWGGMTNVYDRPYHFLLNGDGPQPRLAMVIAARMNSVFHGGGERAGKVAEATVKGRPLVSASVPASYRLNHQRFILVARNVLLSAPAANDPIRKKLDQELLVPETTIQAAIKLEALGSEAETTLRIGLEDRECPWVRFAAAQSLCYLGKADEKAARVLAECAEKHPSMRTHALLALASQDDAPCVNALVDLMKRSDVSLRYGAYAALRAADENHEAIRGRRMANSYWLHTIATESDSLVHLTTERRNEVVLFGHAWPITGEFAFPLGNEFTITRKAGDETVVISRIVEKDGEPTTLSGKYRPDLAHVLKGLAEMGATYSEAVEFIRRVHAADALAVKLAVDAQPRGFSIQELSKLARKDPLARDADTLARKSMGNAADSSVVQAGGFDITTAAEENANKPRAPIVPMRNRDPGRLFD